MIYKNKSVDSRNLVQNYYYQFCFKSVLKIMFYFLGNTVEVIKQIVG